MTEYITPLIISIIIIVCFFKKVPLYEAVTKGAEDGMKIVAGILPTMIVILSAISMLNASGVLSFFITKLSPVTDFFNIPREVMPMILLRPVSGSGAFGILSDILSRFGADTRSGNLASVIMGSTETTFYTMAVYFGGTKVKSIKRAIPCAVIGDIVGVITALLLIR